MAQEINIQKELHYYSEELTQKLFQLHGAAAAVVEAPSGYGKTTAVRDCFSSAALKSMPVHWFSAAAEEPVSAYRRLCRAIGRIDPKTEARLLKIGLPCPDAMGEACDVLRSIRCRSETWLVIDNFHLLFDLLPSDFLSCLLAHGSEKLHVVIITQFLRPELLAFLYRRGLPYLTQTDLCLSAADIRSYYRLAGKNISEQDAKYVEHSSGGWMTAVCLHLCALRERGAFLDAPGILSLMEQLVWDALDDTRRMFLLRLSPFETITLRQVKALCGEFPVDARSALQLPFLRFDPAERRYELHELLARLLRKKRRERGAAFDRECFARAGDLCRDEGQSLRALEFYSRAGDFRRMFSLNLSDFYAATVGGIPFYKLAIRIVRACPPEMMRENLLSMLRIAYALLAGGMERKFSTLMDKLYPFLDGDGEEGSWLLADWTLLSSYRSFPDLAKMTGELKRAADLFCGRRSRVIFPDSPWCYSVMTPFLVFHSEAGNVPREAEALEKYFALYTGMTGGHGAGADILFCVEHAYYMGNFPQGEVLAYKAAFVAQNSRQEIIRLAATLCLAWSALQKRDARGRNRAFDALTGPRLTELLEHAFVLPAARDTVHALLVRKLDMSDERVPRWLREGDFSGGQLPHIRPLGLLVHLDYLRHSRNFLQLAGTVNTLYSQRVKVGRFGSIYAVLIAAAGCAELGHRRQAVRLICRAAAFLLEDGLYAQLVVYDGLLNGLVEKCIRREFPEHAEPFCKVREQVGHALASIFPELARDELSQELTQREREVALLAASGLTNEEIAGRLYLTSNTVRTHLRAVFRKLKIDRRSKLVEKLC